MKNEDRRGAPRLWYGAAALIALIGVAALLAGNDTPSRFAGLCLLLTAAALMAWMESFQQHFVRPLERMGRLLTDEEAGAEQLRQEAEATPGLAGEVEQAMAARMDEMDRQLSRLKATADAQAQQSVRRELTLELCRSALPQVLRDSPATATFALAGMVEEAPRLSCTFYDYFFIDPGLLCIMVGQVPGDSIADALYMVVAQTTIRSRLRMGRSLVETMADVNAQLYDQGAKQSLCALVGTLPPSTPRWG